MGKPSGGDWAREEFGAAKLGNKLRAERLVKVAAQALEQPAGKLTEVFHDAADREGAYRLMESPHVSAGAVGRAAWLACALRCKDEEYVVVAVDGTSETLQDRTGAKGFGPVGSRTDGARGVHTMNAIAIGPQGASIGMAFQAFWNRSDQPAKVHRTKRPLEERETRFWVETFETVDAVFSEAGVRTTRWYQLDAGADAREVLLHATKTTQRVTVRACRNRVVKDEQAKYLWDAVSSQPVLGTYELTISPGRKRAARNARIEVRASRVRIQPTHAHASGREEFELYGVLAREHGTTPAGEEPIEWLLLTNHEATTFEAARLTITNYSYRWRIEEFHKTWKSVCKLEESQLDQGNFETWATILASVAIRVERLKYLTRTQPELPASAEFSPDELEALLLLKKATALKPSLTLRKALGLVAELGGYTGKSSGGPPGSTTIFRGLEYLKPAAALLAAMRDQAKT